MEQQQWLEEYQALLNSPPVDDEIILGSDGQPIKLTIDIKPNEPPFIYGKLFVPDKVGCDLGWFARNIEDKSRGGWRFIMIDRARQDILAKLGFGPVVPIKSIRIIGLSTSGSSYLATVHEFLSDDDLKFAQLRLTN